MRSPQSFVTSVILFICRKRNGNEATFTVTKVMETAESFLGWRFLAAAASHSKYPPSGYICFNVMSEPSIASYTLGFGSISFIIYNQRVVVIFVLSANKDY